MRSHPSDGVCFYQAVPLHQGDSESLAALQQSSEAAVGSVIRSLSFQANDQVPEYPDPENAFLIGWPEGLNYQKLADLVLAQDPKLSASTNTLALLTIWLSGCLPDPIPAGEPA
jgi:hypothetical protein